MKYIKTSILITIIALNTSVYATGSKRVPPIVQNSIEKILLETIIDVLLLDR